MKSTNTTLSIKNTKMIINQFLGNKIGVISVSTKKKDHRYQTASCYEIDIAIQ
jgi:hypothetical protein